MMQKIRREGMRWQIISMLDKARPITAHERFIVDVVRGIYKGTDKKKTNISNQANDRLLSSCGRRFFVVLTNL